MCVLHCVGGTLVFRLAPSLHAVIMDNGYELCEYVDESDEPFIGGVDFIATDDDVSEVSAIVTEPAVETVNIIGTLTPLPQRRGRGRGRGRGGGRGRPPQSESEAHSVCVQYL